MHLSSSNLSKTYTGVRTLHHDSLEIRLGMCRPLRPNGAGKSTLMRILATLEEAGSGADMLGHRNVLTQREEVRKILGYLPQDFGVYPRISAHDMFEHLALLRGVTRSGERTELVHALLQRVNL